MRNVWKQIIALTAALTMLAGLSGIAFAANDEVKMVSASYTQPTVAAGGTVKVEIPLAYSGSDTAKSVSNVVVELLNLDASTFDLAASVITNSSITSLGSADGTKKASFDLVTKGTATAGIKNVQFKVTYTDTAGTANTVANISPASVQINVTADPGSSSSGTVDFGGDEYVQLDASAKVLGARNKESVTFTVPIKSIKSKVYALEIEPIISVDPNVFPFVIDQVSYVNRCANTGGILDANGVYAFQFPFTVNAQASTGAKEIGFTVRYKLDPSSTTFEETSVNMLFNVQPERVSTGGGGSSFRSAPKVIIESFSFSEEKLYAGEPFTLTLKLKNTSEYEMVKNMQMSIVDESNNVLPTNNASNSIFVGSINKNETATVTMALQAVPSAEAKAYTMAVSMAYDGAKTRASYTVSVSIAIPIQQRIRVKFDAPVIYDEAWVGQNTGMAVALYNMGKSTIYNCMIDVEGQGLAMAETYFGGNISSGNTMRADFNIKTDVGGEIDGTVVVSYENVYGDKLEERLPFKLMVNEQPTFPEGVSEGADPMVEGGATENNGGGNGWIGWTAGGVGVAGVGTAAALLIRKRKQHKRELEEL